MARRRLTPAQPGYLAPAPAAGTPDPRPSGLAPIAQVSGQSAEAAALQEMSQALQEARDQGQMVVDVPLTDVSPGYLLRDRIQLDRDELEALKASIRAHGQRTPAEITPLAVSEDRDHGGPVYRFGLISGWRRLTALNELLGETGEPRFSTLRALIRPPEIAAESYVAMVEENEIRVGLSYYERARVVAELAARGVFPDQQAAVRALFATASKAKRSKIVSFIDIHDRLGQGLRDPAAIPERLGLALVARLRQASAAEVEALRREIEQASSVAAEQRVLEAFARPPKQEVSRAKPEAELIAPGLSLRGQRQGRSITLTLSGAGIDEALLQRALAALRHMKMD